MRCDVLVVGAGPAGSMAARAVAQAGFTTVVVEKSRLDREKPCAGGLSAKVIRDYQPPSHVCEREIWGAAVYSPSGRAADVAFKHPAWTTMRSTFDRAMSQRALDAGAEIREETKATAATFRDGRLAEVVTKHRGKQETVQASFTIMADGYPTMLVRYFKVYRRNPMSIAACVQRHLEMPEGTIEERMGGKAETYFGDQVIPRGYAWIFPKRRLVSVGLGTWVETIREQKIDLWKRLDNFVRHHPIASTKLEGSIVKLRQAHMICCSQEVERICGDGFLLVGDAGGFVSAITGEGIWYAMKTGEAAGRSVVTALEENQSPQKIMEIYSKNISARVTDDMRLGPGIKRRFLEAEDRLEILIAAVRRDKWFQGMLGELVNGSMSYKEWTARLRRHPEKLIKAALLYR
ncbi:MAG: NAD(P)/FAD-dependent oxidoreductase [Nitrososphaeria archaeon]